MNWLFGDMNPILLVSLGEVMEGPDWDGGSYCYYDYDDDGGDGLLDEGMDG